MRLFALLSVVTEESPAHGKGHHRASRRSCQVRQFERAVRHHDLNQFVGHETNVNGAEIAGKVRIIRAWKMKRIWQSMLEEEYISNQEYKRYLRRKDFWRYSPQRQVGSAP